MSPEMVKYSTLCHLLNIRIGTVHSWRDAGHITPYAGGMYSVSSVNSFLRSCAKGFEPAPPTLADLRSRQVVVLRAVEIRSQYGFTPKQLYNFIKSGKLAYFKFPGKRGAVRYWEKDIRRLSQGPTGLSVQEARKVLGRSKDVVFRLIRENKLECLPSLDKTRRYVSEESLLRLLREWLPAWVDPEDWIEDCRAAAEPLIPLASASIRLGLSTAGAFSALKERQGHYILGPRKGKVMVSPIWLAAHEENQQRLTAQKVASLFDVSAASPFNWQQKGLIVCPIIEHNHGPKTFLFRACWVAIIKSTCSPGYELQIARLVSSRLSSITQPSALLGLGKTAKILQVSCSVVKSYALSGELRGIRTPTGIWLFHERQVKETKAKLAQN